MQTITPRFAAALTKDHEISTRVEVWAGFGVQQLATLYPVDGSVTEDIRNSIRRSMTMTVTDTDGSLIPLLGTDPLTPYGNEILIYTGIDYQDGTVEQLPVGVYAISDVDLQLTATDLGIAITAKDRADTVSRRKLTDYYVIPAGTDRATAIQALIQQAVPQFTSKYFSFATTTGDVTPLVVLSPGADPWAEAQTLASSGGYDLYFNQAGICTLVAVPDPQVVAISWVYNVDPGSMTSLLDQLNRKLTNQGVFNHVIVQASGTGLPDPIRADAWDNNRLSPTYIGDFYGTPNWIPSSYGDVVTVISTSTVTTSGGALQAATAALNQALGLTATGSFGGLSNPAHLVNDVIQIQSSRIGYASKAVVLDSFTIPLSYGGSMSGNVRLVAGR